MKKKNAVKTFKRGQIVQSGNLVVFVCGNPEPMSYPTFAGVVVHSQPDGQYPVGFFSETWTREDFKATGISMKKLIANALKIDNDGE